MTQRTRQRTPRPKWLPPSARRFVYDHGAIDMVAMHAALYVNFNLSAPQPPGFHEAHFQQGVMSYIDRKYPTLARLAFHVPLELLRNKAHNNAGIYHALGTRAGVADVVFLKPSGAYHGLVMELKVRPRRPTISQCEFLQAAREAGYAACWTDCYGTALQLLDAYIKLPPRALLRELTPNVQENIDELRTRKNLRQAYRHRKAATKPAVDAGTTTGSAPAARHAR